MLERCCSGMQRFKVYLYVFSQQNASVPSMEPTVFISYSFKDKEIASEIATFLAAENINVWFDVWKITLGDSTTEEIQRALECTHFVVLISRNTKTSRFQKREFQSALACYIKKGTPKILPILLDDSEAPKLLADIRYWKYEGGTERDRDEIVRSITGRSPSQNFIRAIVKKYHELVIDTTSGSDLSLLRRDISLLGCLKNIRI